MFLNSFRIVLIASLLATDVAAAGNFPSRPLRLVIPFPAGGTTDVNARVLAARLDSLLGQPVVVDNRVGANGIIATELVARAAPDGHTLLYVSSSISLNPSIYKQLPYDTVRDFVPVTAVAQAVGFLLVAGPSLPAATVKELVALAKKPDAKVSFGSPGYGNSLHLAGGNGWRGAARIHAADHCGAAGEGRPRPRAGIHRCAALEPDARGADAG